MESFMYLCKMKSIILLFLLCSSQLFGQRILLTPHNSRMDSIARSNVHSCIVKPYHKANGTIFLHRYIKFTFKTFINMDLITKLDSGEKFKDFDLQDYAGMGRFDIRMKVYTSRNTRFVSRMIASGIDTQGYSYSCGFIIKF